MRYRYETHLHTAPASKCGKATVEETIRCYAERGYDGVFITNHYLDGNIGIEHDRSFEEKIEFYLSDYYEGVRIGKELGIKVFFGVELSYCGTDFLVYGLTPDWFRAHPEILDMKKSAELPFLREQGALVIQAHPFREAGYIDHIRLFPRCVDGVEVINAGRTDFENRMAEIYAGNYGFLRTAGTDNHKGGNAEKFAGMESDTPLENEQDFIHAVRSKTLQIFTDFPAETEKK